MSAHTPEPWRTSGDDCKAFIIDVKGDDIACCDYRVNGDANAARIVACVNACVGINPEAVPDLLAALEDMLNPNALDDAGHKARCAIAKAKGD